MSACFTEDMLLSFSEQKLSDADASAVSAHLDGCSDCRIIVSELARGQTEAHVNEPERPLVRGSALGRYLVLEQIGAGGMGVVYAAYDPDLDRRVALKLLRHAGGEKQRARLVREARAMARLSHPNVAPVFGVETLGDRVFVVMEFIVGENARRWAREERTAAEVLDVFVQAGRGLEAAHHAGIVHRDFKPDNMMVRPNGRVSVLDFGLARPAGEGAPGVEVERPASPSSLTETGTVMGTFAYMPPEQRLGLPTDARADQYAFCVSLHEVLYGAPPTEAPKRTPKVGAVVTRVLARGLQPDAAARFPDMQALLVELERARAPARRWGWAVAAAAALGSVAVAGALLGGAEPCAGGEAEVARAWGTEQREAVARAFAAGGTSPDAIRAALDGYRAKWVGAQREACEATRVKGVQSEELLDRRMLCLGARKAALGATARALASGGPSLQRAPLAVAQLPLIDDCADARWLLEAVPPPSDAATRAKLAEVRERLATVNALTELGRVDEGTPLAAAVVAEARQLGYAPLLAEALESQVDLLRWGLETTPIEVAAWHGVQAALQSRDDRLQARAWLNLGDVVGTIMRRPAEGHHLLDVAKTAIDALEAPGLLEAGWYRSTGKLLEIEGDAEAAIASFHQALERYSSDPRTPRGVETWVWRRIAINHQWARQHDLAETAARKAVELAEKDVTGASQLDIALSTLADALRSKHDYEGARSTLARSLALSRKSGSTRRVAINLMTLGELERDAGDLARAEDWFLQLAACAEQLPDPNPYFAQALGLLGSVQLLRKDTATAVRTLTKSVSLFDRFGLQNDLETVPFRLSLVEAELAAAERALAEPRLEHVLGVLGAAKADAKVLAQPRFHAARLAWQTGKRPLAVQLATTALAASAGEEHGEISDWLSKHAAGR
ncbi:MAG: protein kinase [Myxococcaceae bacterium]|nr:protein kinase [Myxococcaceae bacterium]